MPRSDFPKPLTHQQALCLIQEEATGIPAGFWSDLMDHLRETMPALQTAAPWDQPAPPERTERFRRDMSATREVLVARMVELEDKVHTTREDHRVIDKLLRKHCGSGGS